MSQTLEKQLKILIIDDELAIRRYLKTALTAYSHNIIDTGTGEDGILQCAKYQPDLIILDLNLPDMTGVQVTERIREWSDVPIIILSVQNQDTDKIESLDAGADDYLTKPFSMGELMARIRVALRHRKKEEQSPVFEVEGLKIDMNKRQVIVDSQDIQLSPTEYDLLIVLVKYAGRVITHRQLLKEIRGTGYQTEIHLLRVHVSNLRRKLEKDATNPQYILTEPGVGYRLRAD
jgi:two-component system KDP operon response regulator KdpE